MRATKALIHLDLLKKNIEAVRTYIGQKPLICVPVKADAYGHGAVRVSTSALNSGVDFLGVAAVEEGVELRRAGITAPILLFSLPIHEELDELVINQLTPFVADKEYALTLGKVAKKMGVILPVHIKIDTGMGRVGCNPSDAADLAVFISQIKSLYHEGTATHFAVSDSLIQSDIEFTKIQLERFNFSIDEIKKMGLNPGILHAANSGAVLLHKDSYFDMVRPGILLYGYPPIENSPVKTEPIMELISSIVFIKKMKKGDSLSYGRTWVAPEDTTIATLPIGYADGLPRRLSNTNFKVLINEKLYPVVGRICMDQFMVDIGNNNTEVKLWDRVVIFGGKGAYNAQEIAHKLDNISYEIMSMINKRIPRIYIGWSPANVRQQV